LREANYPTTLSAARSKVKKLLTPRRPRYNADMILVGTAGWSYPDWEGIAYPKADDGLRTVARYLDCVEIDSSFYRPPTERMTAAWVKATPPEFRFLAKAWQRFTHERQTKWSPAELDLFLGGLAPLRDRLDALLFQFPWSFRNEPRNRDWLASLADAFDGWPFAVEVRHDSWTPDAFGGWIYCNVDQPQLKHCLPPADISTSDTGYYRLHGRNAKNWFEEKQTVYGGRYDYLYSDAELDELLGKIRAVAAKTKKTFVIFNNHKDAKAFSNALQLKAAIAPPVRAPAALVARYPALRGKVTVDGEQQLLLLPTRGDAPPAS
jgi:uncharacterized protein YecE (DUF72 family)